MLLGILQLTDKYFDDHTEDGKKYGSEVKGFDKGQWKEMQESPSGAEMYGKQSSGVRPLGGRALLLLRCVTLENPPHHSWRQLTALDNEQVR